MVGLIILAQVVALVVVGIKCWNNFAEKHNAYAKEHNEFLKSYLDAMQIIEKNYAIFSSLGIEYYTDSAKQLIGIANRLLMQEKMLMETNPKKWANATFKEYKKCGDFNKFLCEHFAAIKNLFGEYGINNLASYSFEQDLQKLMYRPKRR